MRATATMFKSMSFALLFLAPLAAPASAEPPADVDACLSLYAQITKSAGANIKSEAEYAKFYLRQLDLQSACGQRDFVEAEKIANEIRATFHLD